MFYSFGVYRNTYLLYDFMTHFLHITVIDEDTCTSQTPKTKE